MFQPTTSTMTDDGSLLPLVHEAIARAPGWSAVEGEDGIWIYVEPAHIEIPERGWKLHVSAAAWTAHDVLERCLPVLLSEDVPFKVARSVPALMDINEGAGGIDQAGKFVTVYAGDGSTAVRVAIALDEATMGLRGPMVRGDVSISDRSLVHYRYGEFRPGAGDGEPPEDPFVAAGVVRRSDGELVAGRFLITSTLHRSVRGAVHLAVDAVTPRSCILKQAYRDARLQPDGRDARDHLRHEAGVLERVREDHRFPVLFQTIEHAGDLFLAMELIDGTVLSRYVEPATGSPRPLGRERLVDWGAQTADALQHLHELGLAYRDLSPENVIVGRDGCIRLIDFELTAEIGAVTTFYSAGTPGFTSPQQAGGAPAAVADDVYGLGCLLAYAATGTDPAPAEVTGSMAGPGIEALIASCMDPDPSRRPGAAADVARSLREAV